jgi:hypothetical protein
MHDHTLTVNVTKGKRNGDGASDAELSARIPRLGQCAPSALPRPADADDAT